MCDIVARKTQLSQCLAQVNSVSPPMEHGNCHQIFAAVLKLRPDAIVDCVMIIDGESGDGVGRGARPRTIDKRPGLNVDVHYLNFTVECSNYETLPVREECNWPHEAKKRLTCFNSTPPGPQIARIIDLASVD